jgi:hypothetical protein
MISESSVSRLSIGLNLFDLAVECLNGLVRVPVFIKAFGVGSEVDGCGVTIFVKEVLKTCSNPMLSSWWASK